MRSDVSKIISERPKSNRTWTSKTPRRKQVTVDLLGDQIDENSNHIRQGRQKRRKARYNILERFLVHCVGRPWDKVYAETCDVADARSFSGSEIRDFVKSFVATECWMEGRTVMSHDCFGGPQIVRGLYVHPKSGLLLRNDIAAQT